MKVLLVFSIIVASYSSSYCQSYRHNIGMGYLGAFQSFGSGNISVFELNASLGIRYMAALKWPINDKLDFVTSIDPCLFAFPTNSINRKTIAGSFDIPLDLKFYFGGIDKTSFFLGTNVDYFWVNWAKGKDFGLRSFGPQICLGFNHKVNNTGIGGRASFTYGLTKQQAIIGSSETRSSLFSLGIFMILPAPKG